MELILTTIRAYDKNTIGCRRHRRSVMISFQYRGDKEAHAVHDLFLTAEQARELHAELGAALKRNEPQSTQSDDA